MPNLQKIDRLQRMVIAQGNGFSLFELVVFIICVAIIYSSAANRFADFPGEAERANFLAVSTQIGSAVNLELIRGMVAANNLQLSQYEAANPMNLLLEPPSNYLGEYEFVASSSLPRRSWYFDTSSRELVYLINAADDVFLIQNGDQVSTSEIRFRIEIDYRYEDRTSGLVVNDAAEKIGAGQSTNLNRRLLGMAMRPVTPYIWGTSPTFMRDYGTVANQSN